MSRGITLIEVLLAVAILSFITAILGGSLVRQIQTKDVISAMTERENTARTALTRMSREISMAFISKHYNCAERRTITSFKSDGEDELTFTSFSHYKWVRDANESDQNEITYTLKNDPDDSSTRALFRRENTRISENTGKADKDGKDYVLAHNISKMQFEFYNQDTDAWEKEWDTTRAERRFKLPLYVRITLEMPWTDGKPRKLVTQSRIMLQDALSFGPNICLN